MEDAGQRLKKARERLGLKYRDVEEFSQQISDRRKNNEFTIAISRLSDIENRGVMPSIYKIYSMCAIYRLEVAEVLRWYGVDAVNLPADAASLTTEKTHLIGFGRENLSKLVSGEIQVPLSLDPGLDLSKTTFLSRFIQSWGVLPLMLVSGYDPKNYRYGWIGSDDWMMYPVLQPGALVLIDESRRRVAAGGWQGQSDRPVYFLEHRQGWVCSWCSLSGDRLVAVPHPASPAEPLVFAYPSEVEVIGQVVGLANRLNPASRPRTRS